MTGSGWLENIENEVINVLNQDQDSKKKIYIYKKNYVNKPSPFFTNQIIPLRKRILQKFKDIENEKTTRYSINEWFLFAGKFWSFTGSFKNLTDF